MTHAATLDRFFEALNAHDVDRILDHFTAGGIFSAPFGPAPFGNRFEGQVQLRQAFEAAFQRMPDVCWQQATHVPSGSKWLSEWMMRWTGADGQLHVLQGCDIFVFDGDLIATKDTFIKQTPS